MSDMEQFGGPASDAQIEYLLLLKVPFQLPLSWFTASRLIEQAVLARRRRYPTERQEGFLKRRDRWRDDLTRDQATALIGQIIEQENRAGR